MLPKDLKDGLLQNTSMAIHTAGSILSKLAKSQSGKKLGNSERLDMALALLCTLNISLATLAQAYISQAEESLIVSGPVDVSLVGGRKN